MKALNKLGGTHGVGRVDMVENRFWYAPERLALQAYVEESQKNVTGTVRVKLCKGGLYVVG